MKKISFKITIAALLIVLASSCSKYLDIAPENKVPVQNVDYTNIASMYGPVSGVYATANSKFSFWGELGLSIVRGDDVDKGGSAPDQIEFTYAKSFQYNKLTSFWALNATWQNLYTVVTTANQALLSLNKYAANIAAKDTADLQLNESYKAEVRFLRAYAFFRISNYWGDVPLVLDTTPNPHKTSVADVRKFIINELTDCAAKLPDARPNENSDHMGAVTKYSALALMAKVYLYNGDNQNVVATTDAIINSGKFSLYNDYYNLFKIPGKLCNESLYELQFSDFGTGSGDISESDQWFVFQGPAGSNFPSFISGWGFIAPTSDLQQFFATRGEPKRTNATFLFTGGMTPSLDSIGIAPAGRQTCYNGKAYTPSNQMTPGRTTYGDNNNVRVLRYADVLLMNAEAKVRMGQSGDDPLNTVRQRAGLSNITGATLNNILDERRAELAMEWGERFYDLVRTGKAATLLPGFVVGQSEYYPIPQAQKDLNPNL